MTDGLPGDAPRPVVLFDGVCVLCNASVRFVLARETGPQLQFCAVQSPQGQALLSAHGITSGGLDSFVLIEDGTAWQRSAAAFRLARYLRRPWRWLGWLSILPAGICDRVYDCVARNRYRLFGTYDSCLIPPPGQRDRFLT
jgi:predicted DCC family thiol-disulfide oxidoreductase YuxK